MTSIKDKAYNAFMDQPKWAKGVEIALFVGVVVFSVGLPIVRLIRNKLDTSKVDKERAQAGKELNRLAKQGIDPSINKTQAESMSNILVGAFNGVGTNENSIYNVFDQLKNEADIYFLIEAYGVRRYGGTFIWSADSEGTLSQAISDELTPYEIDHLNEILSKKGIKFQFA